MEEKRHVATWKENQIAHGQVKMKLPFLQDWRLYRKLTVERLAWKSGVSASTIHKLELNQTMAEPATIQKLRIALDMPMAQGFIEQYDAVIAGAQRYRGELVKRVVENLRQRRKACGWSQVELAEKSGVAVNTVRNAEAGVRVTGEVKAKIDGVLPPKEKL